MEPTASNEQAPLPAHICTAFKRTSTAEGVIINEAELLACTNQLSQIKLDLNNPKLWSEFSACMLQIQHTSDANDCVEMVKVRLDNPIGPIALRPSDEPNDPSSQTHMADIELICRTVKQASETEGKVINSSDWDHCLTEMNHLHQIIGHSAPWRLFKLCMQGVKTEMDAIACTQQVMTDSLDTPTFPSVPTP